MPQLRNISWKYSLIVGLVFVWVSVIVVPYGTYLQALSPNFREYERHVAAEIAAQESEKDLAPGIGVGLALSSAWPFVSFCCAVAALLFTVGIMVLQKMAVGARVPAFVVLGVFVIGCLGGAFLGVSTAIDSLQWGYIILSAGHLLASVGLIFSAIGMLSCYLTGSDY